MERVISVVRRGVMRIVASAVFAGLAGLCPATTYYKIGADAGGKHSYYWNGNGTGWSLTEGGAKVSISGTDFAASDFVIVCSNNTWNVLRTPADSSSSHPFPGQSLRLVSDGGREKANYQNILVKSKHGASLTFNNLIFEDGVIYCGEANRSYDLKGDFNIVPNKCAAICAYNGTGTGLFIVTAPVHGDVTTKIRLAPTFADVNAAATGHVLFRDLSDFYGIVEDELTNPANAIITIDGAFNGSIGELSPKAQLRVKYDGLPAGQGLRVTMVTDALRTNLKLYSSEGLDFEQDNLPLLRFPAGTVVDPGSFTISHATGADAVGTPIQHALKTYVDADDNNAVVLAVDAAAVAYAKLKDGGAGGYTWRFYDGEWRDITASCGLTEPTAAITVCFDSSAEFEAIKARTCTAKGYRMTAFEVMDDVDLTSGGFEFTTEPGITIDLAGHAVTVPPSFFPGEKTVTDTATEGGELRIDVPDGITAVNDNSATELTGSLKVVKIGKGTFKAAKDGQSYTGGTEVNEGVVVTPGGTTSGSGAIARTDMTATSQYLGAQGSEIKVGEGGALYLAGNYDYYVYHIILNGGILRSAMENNGQVNQQPAPSGRAGLGWLTLTADSTIEMRSSLLFSGKDDTPIDLGGKVLTIDCYVDGKTHYWRKDVVNGTLNIKGTSGLSVGFQMSDVTLTDVTLVDSTGINIQGRVNVSNYTAAATWDNPNCDGSAALNVFGTFKPESIYFYGCTLQDGAKLDLSEQIGVWNSTSASTKYGSKTLVFADGATVTIDVGDRAVEKGEMLVAWDAKPANVDMRTFCLAGTAIPVGARTDLIEGGICVFDPNMIVKAKWTGAAENGSISDPANWVCTTAAGDDVTTALPGDQAVVHFTGSVPDIPKGATFVAAKVVASARLAANCDWSGLDIALIAADSEIDLNGHNLKIALAASPTRVVTFTDSSAEGGELHVTVPSETEVVNTTVAFLGSLKFVKEGEGVFVANRNNQTYSGGTIIAAGTATVPLSGSTGNAYSFLRYQYGSAKGEIRIEPGATFDTRGNYDFYCYDIKLNGGVLANTGCDQTKYSAGWGCAGNVTLTSNSQYCVSYWTAHSTGTIDLGGKELEVKTSTADGILIFRTAAATNGTLKASGEGRLQFEGATADMYTTDLVLGTPICVLDTDINVRNVTTVDYAGAGIAVEGRSRCVNIFGTYKPGTDYAHNFTMQDGSTIDLSERSAAFDVRERSLGFAEGATIKVDLGEREVHSRDPIILWNEKPKDVRFVPTVSRLCYLEARGDGLYPRREFCIIVR